MMPTTLIIMNITVTTAKLRLALLIRAKYSPAKLLIRKTV
jgi:hypothetical protein